MEEIEKEIEETHPLYTEFTFWYWQPSR